jgi:hypothetical protein
MLQGYQPIFTMINYLNQALFLLLVGIHLLVESCRLLSAIRFDSNHPRASDIFHIWVIRLHGYQSSF